MTQTAYGAQGPILGREFLLQAWERRTAAACAFAAVLGVCLVIAALVPPGFRAQAILAVLPAPEFTVRQDAGSRDQASSALALDQIMKAETEILASDDLHLATLARLGADRVYPEARRDGARGWLGRALHAAMHGVISVWIARPADPDQALTERRLRQFGRDLLILPAKDSNIISIGFFAHDPQVAADAINTMLALYAGRRRALYDDPQFAVASRELDRLGAAAGEAERRLDAFKQRHAISDFSAQQALLIQRANTDGAALAAADVAVAGLEGKVASLETALRREPATIGIFAERDPDTRSQLGEAALEDVRTRYASAADRYRSGSRLLTQLRAEIAARESALGGLDARRAASVVREGRNPNLDQLRLDRARTEAELAQARATRGALAAQCSATAAGLAALDRDEAALSVLERARTNGEELFRGAARLASERHLTEAEDALRLSRVRVIQPARVPQAASALPVLIGVAGVLLGVLASCVWLAVVFVWRGVFLTEQGLEQALGLPALASFSVVAVGHHEVALVP